MIGGDFSWFGHSQALTERRDLGSDAKVIAYTLLGRTAPGSRIATIDLDDLSRRAGMTPAKVQKALKELVRKGYARREDDHAIYFGRFSPDIGQQPKPKRKVGVRRAPACPNTPGKRVPFLSATAALAKGCRCVVCVGWRRSKGKK